MSPTKGAKMKHQLKMSLALRLGQLANLIRGDNVPPHVLKDWVSRHNELWAAIELINGRMSESEYEKFCLTDKMLAFVSHSESTLQ